MTTVITFGTFDVLHVGHLRILQRSRNFGDRLVVGVSSDALNFAKKGRYPVFDQDERCELVASLACVDEVFVEESLELKRDYMQKYTADVLVMGDDWAGKFDHLADICRVVYLPRTPSISTTAVIEKIARMSLAERHRTPVRRLGPGNRRWPKASVPYQTRYARRPALTCDYLRSTQIRERGRAPNEPGRRERRGELRERDRASRRASWHRRAELLRT